MNNRNFIIAALILVFAAIVANAPIKFDPTKEARVENFPITNSLKANKFTVENKDSRQLVVYWFKSNDLNTYSYLKQQIKSVAGRMLGKQASGAMIRVSTEIKNNNPKFCNSKIWDKIIIDEIRKKKGASMKFLVTGGAGFIGSHIVERLLKEGHFVRVLDNFSSGKESNLAFTKGLTPNTYDLIKGDIRDKSTCDKACAGIDYVLHQAALRSVPKSMKDPESYNEVNINGTLYMLQAAAKNKVKRFVLASSSSVYGDTSKFPEQESDYPLLISPYALSKLAGEYYCRIFSEHFGVETIALRYFNVFGPKQALDDEYAVVIPKFIHCILHDEQPPIFGTGKQSRDFTYIDNVVEANILAATKVTVTLGRATTQSSTSPTAKTTQFYSSLIISTKSSAKTLNLNFFPCVPATSCAPARIFQK